jgi:hypothetical protein
MCRGEMLERVGQALAQKRPYAVLLPEMIVDLQAGQW